MNKKDLINEYIGIIAMIVIICLAVVGIYFYLKDHPNEGPKEIGNAAISSLINPEFTQSHKKLT